MVLEHLTGMMRWKIEFSQKTQLLLQPQNISLRSMFFSIQTSPNAVHYIVKKIKSILDKLGFPLKSYKSLSLSMEVKQISKL